MAGPDAVRVPSENASMAPGCSAVSSAAFARGTAPLVAVCITISHGMGFAAYWFANDAHDQEPLHDVTP